MVIEPGFDVSNWLSRAARLGLCLAILLAAQLSAPVRAAPTAPAAGGLDPTFGGYGEGGRVIGDPFPGTSIRDVVVQDGEKVIAVGSDGQDFVIARYDADGHLDPTFGVNGVTRLDFYGYTDYANAVTIDYPGDILVVGTAFSGTGVFRTSDFAVARLNADGTPDTAFSQDGKNTIDFNGRRDVAEAVLPWHTGGLMAAGSAERDEPMACTPGCPLDLAFAAFTAAGEPESGSVGGFLDDGKVTHDFGADEVALAIVPGAGGYSAVGFRYDGAYNHLVAQLTNGGTLNTSFSGDGVVTGTVPSMLVDAVWLGLGSFETLVGIGDAGGDFGLIGFEPDGDLDADFGEAGLKTVDLGDNDSPDAVYFNQDGTFDVAGASGQRLGQARFTSQGQVIPGTTAFADLGDQAADTLGALGFGLVPEVRLWTIGGLQAGNTARLVMARYFLDGAADNGGRQATNFTSTDTLGKIQNNPDQAQAAVFQPDGKLIAAGGTTPYSGSEVAAVARYTASGALDPTFSDDGQVTLSAMVGGPAVEVVVQNDERIAIAGQTFNVARLNPDGSPDLTFNLTGYATANWADGRSAAMALQSDGKLVLAGQYGQGAPTIALARFLANGVLDPDFGNGGKVQTGVSVISGAYDVTTQPDGKLIVAGVSSASTTELVAFNFALVRYNPDGSPDLSFGEDGKVTTDFGSSDFAVAVLVQPDGKIVAAGTSGNQGMAFARYNPDGSPDTSFDGDGKRTLQFLGNDVAWDIASDGAAIVAAVCNNQEAPGMVVRLTSTGALDTSFNSTGRMPFNLAVAACPFAIAAGSGRLAAVGFVRGFALSDFAAMVFERGAVEPPIGAWSIYLPLVTRP
jgi:uncharacterized delta-60 repeat protein